MNQMPVLPTHNTIFLGHGINGVGLPNPLKVDTIVTKVSE